MGSVAGSEGAASLYMRWRWSVHASEMDCAREQGKSRVV